MAEERNPSTLTVAELDEMIRDVESMQLEETSALELLRACRAELIDIERDERWIAERVDLRTNRLDRLVVRWRRLLEHGVQMPKAGVSGSKIRREARRLREGQVEPHLSDDAREAKARAIDESADLQQEAMQAHDDLKRLTRELKPLAEKAKRIEHAEELSARDRAREAGNVEAVKEMNRERHRTAGRGKAKKK